MKIGFLSEEELQEVRGLISEIAEEFKELEEDCCHLWSELAYRPKVIIKQVRKQGSESDSIPMYDGYKERWVRVCKKCNKQEFLYASDLENIERGDNNGN